MSTDADRNLEAELQIPEAGEIGLPVDARCTNCKLRRAKRANRINGDVESGSFKHVCPNCRSVTWWNVIEVVAEEVDA